MAWVKAIQDTLNDHVDRKETFERGRSYTKDGSGGGGGGRASRRGSGHAAFAWQQHHDESPERDVDMESATSKKRTAKLTRHQTTTVF